MPVGGQRMRRRFSCGVVLAIVCCALLARSSPARAQEPLYQPLNEDGLQPIELGGFGDPGNTWAASMAWFRGYLFVGTFRYRHCVVFATLAARTGLPLYPPRRSDCPRDPRDLELAAEIWRFDPSDGTWDLVLVSPVDVPIEFDRFTGLPTRFVARDIAYVSMTVHRNSDGTEALYVGATSPAAVFAPVFEDFGVAPPPRLLRSVDGTTFAPIPAELGTFLGELGRPLPGSASVPNGFGALASLGGRLVALLRTSSGAGTLVFSDQPESGNDAWALAGPLPEELPVSALATFNGAIYVGVGAPGPGGGYGISKSSMSGAPPFAFVPVLEQPDAVGPQRIATFAVNDGRLYAGTSWPSELLRIDEDDSWETIVGDARDAGSGPMLPKSGIVSGFGNSFSAAFSSMAAHGNQLYVGTVDASVLARFIPPVTPLLAHEFGFDMLRSEEGIYWYPMTRIGLGSFLQYGVESLTSSPIGLFTGTATGTGGAQVWFQPGATPPVALPDGPAPYRVEAASTALTSGEVVLSWEPVSDAVAYHVYRSTLIPVFGGLVSAAEARERTEIPVSVDASSNLCDIAPDFCVLLEFLGTNFGAPGPFLWTAATTDLFYVEPQPTSLQAIYFVRAELPDGTFSGPSNIVGGASTAAPITFSTVDSDMLTMLDNDELGIQALRSLTMVRRAAYALSGGNAYAAKRLLEIAESIVDAHRGTAIAVELADDLSLTIYRLKRNVQLVEWGLVAADPLM